MSTPTAPKTISKRLSTIEFVALMGVLFATIAFSIDAMLPALPQIAEELSPSRPTLAQLVLTSFVLGMGVGTFLAGPLSDSFGRKNVILLGAAFYMIGAALAYIAPTLELMLAARVLQGLGAAGPRVVSLALIRDLYSGRQMAQVVSFAMLVFTLFPAVAPLIGDQIIHAFGWRAIFLSFLLFSAVSVTWLMLRQPETLPKPLRRPLMASALWDALSETLRHRQMRLSILAQTLIFGALFGTISSIQQVFDISYGQAATFPLWFAAVALMSAPAAPINGIFVTRIGMRPIIRLALWVQAGIALTAAAIFATGLAGPAELWVYFAWTVTIFAMLGFTIGNLNALALEPLGHIAGMAASVMGSLSTVGGAILGAGIGQLFNGTPLPLALATAATAVLAGWIMIYMPRDEVD